MDYKTLLLNGKAYGKISRAKEVLSNRLKENLSFSDVINETLGKSVEFLDVEGDLKAYVRAFAEAMGKQEGILGVMLFGSVAKGIHKQYSDIDMFIVAGDKEEKIEILECVSKTEKKLESQGRLLFNKGLPSSISPLIRRKEELNSFQPIYLDLLDYGVVLYDYADTLRGFLDKSRQMKHKREYTQFGEVVRWQT